MRSRNLAVLVSLAALYFVAGKLGLRLAFVNPSAVVAAVVSTMVSATCGVTTLALAGLAPWANYGSVWLTWWLGDASGDLVVAPFVLLWGTGVRWPWNRHRLFEASVLLASLALVGGIVFCGLFPSEINNYPLEFFCLPFFVWAAFRFGPREVATAVVVLSGIAVGGTLRGLGPFARGTQNESLLLLQSFMGVTALTTLALAAVVSERQRAEAQLRHLAVSDALTGVGNYRQLMLLPATGEGAAHQVARRVRAELGVDTERPALTCSMGVAEYPRDGATAEALLAAADRALYQAKARPPGEPQVAIGRVLR